MKRKLVGVQMIGDLTLDMKVSQVMICVYKYITDVGTRWKVNVFSAAMENIEKIDDVTSLDALDVLCNDVQQRHFGQIRQRIDRNIIG